MSAAAEKIAEEIGKKGAIPFARFMALALYCPNCGYYEREEDIVGRRGDYYTSPSVGSLLGELLALQFGTWLEESRPSSFPRVPGAENAAMQIVEAGAHGGQLARDILTWMLRHRPELFERLQYWIVEPSERRRAWQRRNLVEFEDRLAWIETVAALEASTRAGESRSDPAGARRIIFSNELLDAMPVHRLGWAAKERAWFEWGVTLQSGRFVWTRCGAEGTAERLWELLAGVPQLRPFEGNELLEILPDGFSIEVCPAAEQWWREAAMALDCGKLLTIDYGLTADELHVPQRKEGTLRAYYHHRASTDVLADPGEQDLTAHVNFTAVRAAGEAAGLKTEVFETQERFLTRIAARTWQEEGCFGEWTPERRRQFQTLTHPEHLGRSFRVLVQSRGP